MYFNQPKRLHIILIGILVLLLSLLMVLPAAAVGEATSFSVSLVKVTVPTNYPPVCSGDIDVTFDYASNGIVSFDYTVTVSGIPVSGNITLPSTSGAVVRATQTFTIPVPIPAGTTLDVVVSGYGDAGFATQLDTADVQWLCDQGYSAPAGAPAPSVSAPSVQVAPPTPPPDGRLNIKSADVVLYPNGHDGIDVYGVDEDSNGFLVFSVGKAELNALPDCPATNILIAANDPANPTIALYKLTTCQYQLNIGPDQDGKVSVYIFDTVPPTTFYTSELNVYTP